jgi:hypothetical protein
MCCDDPALACLWWRVANTHGGALRHVLGAMAHCLLLLLLLLLVRTWGSELGPAFLLWGSRLLARLPGCMQSGNSLLHMYNNLSIVPGAGGARTCAVQRRAPIQRSGAVLHGCDSGACFPLVHAPPAAQQGTAAWHRFILHQSVGWTRAWAWLGEGRNQCWPDAAGVSLLLLVRLGGCTSQGGLRAATRLGDCPWCGCVARGSVATAAVPLRAVCVCLVLRRGGGGCAPFSLASRRQAGQFGVDDVALGRS